MFRAPKQDGSRYVTSLDFDDQGDFVVAAGSDETIQVLDVKEGKSSKSVPSKKYGVHLARFTHHPRQVLHASTKIDSMFLKGIAFAIGGIELMSSTTRFPATARSTQ